MISWGDVTWEGSMDLNLLEEILRKHDLWVRGLDGGCRADLGGANLEDANLRGVNLRDANLRGADLEGAKLVGADLRDADLEGADLIGADLRDANLRGANLESANLDHTCVKTFCLGRHFGFYHEGYLQIGCEGHMIEHWLEHVERIGEKYGYSKKDLLLYQSMIDLFYNLKIEGSI